MASGEGWLAEEFPALCGSLCGRFANLLKDFTAEAQGTATVWTGRVLTENASRRLLRVASGTRPELKLLCQAVARVSEGKDWLSDTWATVETWYYQKARKEPPLAVAHLQQAICIAPLKTNSPPTLIAKS